MTHPPEALVRHYSSIDAARAAQQRYESQSLISEFWAARGQLVLHSAGSPDDVATMLRMGAPLDGLKRIDYDDDVQHWETPLLTALVDGRRQVAAALLRAGATPDAPSIAIHSDGHGFGHTALHMMASRRDQDGVRLLLAANADVNLRTTVGWTPLHFAAQKDDDALAQVLIQGGADVGIADFDGSTPIDIAGPRTRAVLRGSRSDGNVCPECGSPLAGGQRRVLGGRSPLRCPNRSCFIGEYDPASQSGFLKLPDLPSGVRWITTGEGLTETSKTIPADAPLPDGWREGLG